MRVLSDYWILGDGESRTVFRDKNDNILMYENRILMEPYRSVVK